MTNEPPPRVAATLSLLREVADEVLVAVDGAIAPSGLDDLAGVADRIFQLDMTGGVDRPRAWLASQCRARWIFWIDGDEVPSAALTAALPRLVEAKDVVQYHLPRRWLFPDEGHWLDENPWWPDHQIRLLRNDPATMRYNGLHEPVVPTLPWRCVEAPLYHLTCLVASLAVRRAKARRYDAERPGMISPGGGPFNDVLQIPEQYATRRPVPIPDEDRSPLDTVLRAEVGSSRPRLAAVPAERVKASVVNAAAAGWDMSADAYHARVEVIERDTRFAPGIPRFLLLRIENLGDAAWPWGWRPRGIYVSYHWRNGDGSPLVHDGRRTPLPSNVRPGESIVLAAHIAPPTAPGRYVLEIDLVHEEVRWFGCSTRLEITVAERWQRP
jgi:hypothetical protein